MSSTPTPSHKNRKHLYISLTLYTLSTLIVPTIYATDTLIPPAPLTPPPPPSTTTYTLRFSSPLPETIASANHTQQEGPTLQEIIQLTVNEQHLETRKIAIENLENQLKANKTHNRTAFLNSITQRAQQIQKTITQSILDLEAILQEPKSTPIISQVPVDILSSIKALQPNTPENIQPSQLPPTRFKKPTTRSAPELTTPLTLHIIEDYTTEAPPETLLTPHTIENEETIANPEAILSEAEKLAKYQAIETHLCILIQLLFHIQHYEKILQLIDKNHAEDMTLTLQTITPILTDFEQQQTLKNQNQALHKHTDQLQSILNALRKQFTNNMTFLYETAFMDVMYVIECVIFPKIKAQLNQHPTDYDIIRGLYENIGAQLLAHHQQLNFPDAYAGDDFSDLCESSASTSSDEEKTEAPENDWTLLLCTRGPDDFNDNNPSTST